LKKWIVLKQSNDRREKIDFIQEIVDNGMVWDMHEKYVNEAKTLNGCWQSRESGHSPKGEKPCTCSGC
jgi:hypothetical protein